MGGSPAPALAGRDPRMALLAKRHKVAFRMGAAFRQRQDMVNLRRCRDPTLAPAYLA